MKLRVILIALCVFTLPIQSVWAQDTSPDEEAEEGDKQPPPREEGFDYELEAIGQIFIEKGELGKALEVYDELRAANPNNLDLLETTISLCKKMGSCFPSIESRFDDLRDYAKRNPKSKSARELLLFYAQESKDTKAVYRAILGMIESNPKVLEHRIMLIEYLEDQRREKELDLELAKLVKLFPKSAQLWIRVAERALDIDKEKQARQALKKSKPFLPPLSKVAAKNEFRNRWTEVMRELSARVLERKQARDRDYRQDTRWADLEDDFVRSTYP